MEGRVAVYGGDGLGASTRDSLGEQSHDASRAE
jgi:hypothetical protein